MLTLIYLLIAGFCFAFFFKSIQWFRQIINLSIMMNILFAISVLVFIYLIYVLLKPEKF